MMENKIIYNAEYYAKIQKESLAKENYIRDRQKLSLKFSYLKGKDREEYTKHILENGTRLESLLEFDKILQNKNNTKEV